MLQREESRHDFAFIAGVIVGAIAGAAATLALTPMSGAETREKLKARTGDLSQVKERAASVASNVPQKMAPVKERAAGVAHSIPQVVAPVKEKVSEMAAKAPRPGQRHEADEPRPSAEDIAVSDGFGPHGAHTEEPAEGAPETIPHMTHAGGGDADVAGQDNPLEDTPAQSVAPQVERNG
jgi:gas vesicle protein